MAQEFLAWYIVYLEHRMRRLERRRQRRNWREMHDPFDIHDMEFTKLYRLNPEIVMDLINILRPRLMHERLSGLSVIHQVDIYIAFYI